MRKIHRTLGLVFAPFLATSAITGLLWAYAPYLYLKADPAKKAVSPVIDENRAYVPVADAIRAAKSLAGEGRLSGVSLRVESGRVVYIMNLMSRSGMKEIWVDSETAEATPAPKDPARQFHSWVMRIHRLSFFGTKKELVAFPGVGLLLMLCTGLFLLKRSSK